MHKFIIALSALIAFGSSHPSLEAATLHAVLVGDTLDESLGGAFESTVNNMHELVEDISIYTDLTLEEHIIMDQDATPKTVIKAIEKLDVQENDVVILYFAIHGYRNADKVNRWPSLFFGVEGAGVDFAYINQIVEEKNPRFFLSIADSCNSVASIKIPTIERKMIPTPLTPMDPNFIAGNYKKLFLTKGRVVVSSSVPGEYAYAYKKVPGNTVAGGLWSVNFFATLKAMVQYHSAPDWNLLMQVVSARIIDQQTRSRQTVQHAQFEVVIDALR